MPLTNLRNSLIFSNSQTDFVFGHVRYLLSIVYHSNKKIWCYRRWSNLNNCISTKYLPVNSNKIVISSRVNLIIRNYDTKNKNCKVDIPVMNDIILPKQLRIDRNKHDQIDTILIETLKNELLSESQCDEIRGIVLKSGISENVVDGLIMNICVQQRSILAGKSYLTYMKSTNKILNLATIGHFMKLCYLVKNSFIAESKTIIESLYEDFILKYPILDANTAEKVLLGISLTKYWKDYRRYLDMIWASCSPSAMSYSAIVQAAFFNKKYKEGWSILNEMANYDKHPSDETYELWLEIVKNDKNNAFLETILNFFSEFSIKPTENIVFKLKETFVYLKKTNTAVITSITSKGMCKNCKAMLKVDTISKQEFKQLKEAFLDPVLIGKDIFIKTRPEELMAFKKFLDETAPYDVVLDGLNIAFSTGLRNQNPSKFSFMIKSVVNHFVQQSKKVLVLGRKHMTSWHRGDLDWIRNNSSVFLAENLSQDDPFLLYATLFSGPNTHFVSRDLMRGHKFLLKDPILKNIFTKWQAQHQLFLIHVNNYGKVLLKLPLHYSQRTQQNCDGTWHIPYRLAENEHFSRNQPTLKTNIEEKIGWLCLRFIYSRTSHNRLLPISDRPSVYDSCQVKSRLTKLKQKSITEFFN